MAGSLSYEQLTHRDRTAAARACRLVPLAVAPLLAALLASGVALPLADQ